MSTSDRTFSQVKAILNKLDRSIDEARERRTQRPAVAAPAPAPARDPQPPPVTGGSPFGRAQPIPSSRSAPNARPGPAAGGPTARWGT